MVLHDFPFGIIMVDTSRRITLWNTWMERYSGIKQQELIGSDLVDRFPDIRERGQERHLDTCIHQERPVHLSPIFHEYFIPLTILRKKEHIRMFQNVRLYPFIHEDTCKGAIIIIENMTEQIMYERELLKVRQLESLGIFAEGIAHDFNNLMAVIMGNVSLAKINQQPGSKIYQRLTAAETASMETRELTERLILFAKGGGPANERVWLPALVRETVDSMLRDSETRADFVMEEDVLPVKADKRQMRQAVRHLVTNAVEAMDGKGHIEITCRNIQPSEKNTLGLTGGTFVMLAIRDHGRGIAQEDLPKIFTPYFSGKQRGVQRGMGLGLAITSSIVRNHEGVIRVFSEPDKGTEFRVYLPGIALRISGTP